MFSNAKSFGIWLFNDKLQHIRDKNVKLTDDDSRHLQMILSNSRIKNNFSEWLLQMLKDYKFRIFRFNKDEIQELQNIVKTFIE